MANTKHPMGYKLTSYLVDLQEKVLATRRLAVKGQEKADNINSTILALQFSKIETYCADIYQLASLAINHKQDVEQAYNESLQIISDLINDFPKDVSSDSIKNAMSFLVKRGKT